MELNCLLYFADLEYYKYQKSELNFKIKKRFIPSSLKNNFYNVENRINQICKY